MPHKPPPATAARLAALLRLIRAQSVTMGALAEADAAPPSEASVEIATDVTAAFDLLERWLESGANALTACGGRKGQESVHPVENGSQQG